MKASAREITAEERRRRIAEAYAILLAAVAQVEAMDAQATAEAGEPR